MGTMVITTLLSSVISSLLLYILNTRIWGIFKPIQRDLSSLSNLTRRILSFAGFLLAIFITIFLRISLNISGAGSGLILGFLGSIVDTCFRNNIIENNLENNELY
ncbi:hypothetical protein [Romboutsia lituseburensis]|uniref:hypothetical protein n=1 Tax=Romboutsia lituseburensis TaxID=1537 RepID=UPI00215AB416|nr:hypothetical protein [Romboutsia lituseburensis]MCR8746839.1 hypothetical protein [Romboutsia lituseburensis]